MQVVACWMQVKQFSLVVGALSAAATPSTVQSDFGTISSYLGLGDYVNDSYNAVELISIKTLYLGVYV